MAAKYWGTRVGTTETMPYSPSKSFAAHANLSDDQLIELAKRLTEKRVELLATLEMLEQQIAAKEDCSLGDAVEAASLQEARARASGIADQHTNTVAEIDLALRRMESGRYGLSELSGDPIAYERLLLIPWARSGADE
jgi:DnaK suppressor protein